MKQLIPRKKLSKKVRQKLDLKQRTIWECNPVTRCPPNPKAYNRNKVRSEAKSLIYSEPCSNYMQNRKEMIV